LPKSDIIAEYDGMSMFKEATFMKDSKRITIITEISFLEYFIFNLIFLRSLTTIPLQFYKTFYSSF